MGEGERETPRERRGGMERRRDGCKARTLRKDKQTKVEMRV